MRSPVAPPTSPPLIPPGSPVTSPSTSLPAPPETGAVKSPTWPVAPSIVPGTSTAGVAGRPPLTGMIALGSVGSIVGMGRGKMLAGEYAFWATWILTSRDLREAVEPAL